MTYNTNSLLKSRTPYDIHMMNIYNRHSNEMNYDLPDIFFSKELNVENYSSTPTPTPSISIPNTDYFTIGSNLSEWGCDNLTTNSQTVIVKAAVPNGNVSANSSTDVPANGKFIFEPFCPNFTLRSNVPFKGSCPCNNQCSQPTSPNICPLVIVPKNSSSGDCCHYYNIGPSMEDWGCNNYDESTMRIVYATRSYSQGITPNSSQSIQPNDLFVVQPGTPSNTCPSDQYCTPGGCCTCKANCSLGDTYYCDRCMLGSKCCAVPILHYIPSLGTLHYMDTESDCILSTIPAASTTVEFKQTNNYPWGGSTMIDSGTIEWNQSEPCDLNGQYDFTLNNWIVKTANNGKSYLSYDNGKISTLENQTMDDMNNLIQYSLNQGSITSPETGIDTQTIYCSAKS